MSETKTVTDFSEPCEHGYRRAHRVVTSRQDGVIAGWTTCLGGVEMTLTKVTAVWEGDMAVIRVDPGGEYWIDLEVAE